MTGNEYDLLLVDGSSFAFRAGNALQNLETETGENTSVIFGVLNMLRSLIVKHHFKDVCVAWDGRNYKEEKRKVYPEYKLNRPEPDEANQGIRIEIRRQINELYKLIPSLGIKQLRRDEIEADDIIGILCEGLSDKKILIVSGDRDLFQLVSHNITMYYPLKEVFITPENFEQEVGVHIDHFIFYKTIVGDSGDNISGLKGFGEVTAKKLLKAHGPWTEWFTGAPNDPTFDPTFKQVIKPEILEGLRKNQKEVLMMDTSLDILLRNYQLMSVGFEQDGESLLNDYHSQTPTFDEELVKSYLLDKKFDKTLARFNGWINPFLELCRRGMVSDN